MTESLEDAKRIAGKVLVGELDAHKGCDLVSQISKRLNSPSNLAIFELLAHEQSGHDQRSTSP